MIYLMIMDYFWLTYLYLCIMLWEPWECLASLIRERQIIHRSSLFLGATLPGGGGGPTVWQETPPQLSDLRALLAAGDEDLAVSLAQEEVSLRPGRPQRGGEGAAGRRDGNGEVRQDSRHGYRGASTGGCPGTSGAAHSEHVQRERAGDSPPGDRTTAALHQAVRHQEHRAQTFPLQSSSAAQALRQTGSGRV